MMMKPKPSVATILRNMGMKNANAIPKNRKVAIKKKSKAKVVASSDVTKLDVWEYVFKHPKMQPFKVGKKTLGERDVKDLSLEWNLKAIQMIVNINEEADEKTVQRFIILGAIRGFNYDFNKSLILISDATGIESGQEVSQENASGVITRKRVDKNNWEVKVTSGTFSAGQVNVSTKEAIVVSTVVSEVPMKKIHAIAYACNAWDAKSTLPEFKDGMDNKEFLNKVKCYAESVKFKIQQADTLTDVGKLKEYIENTKSIMGTIMPIGDDSNPVKAHLLPKDQIYVPILFIALFFKYAAKQDPNKFLEGASGRTPATMFETLEYIKDDPSKNKVQFLLCVLAYAVQAINKDRNDKIQFDGDFLERLMEKCLILQKQLDDILKWDEPMKDLCKIGLFTQPPNEKQVQYGSHACGMQVATWGKQVIILEEGQKWEDTDIGQLIKSTENYRTYFKTWMEKSKPVIGGSGLKLKGTLDFHDIHEDTHPWNILKSNLKTTIDSLVTPNAPAKRIDPWKESLRLLPKNTRKEPHLLLTARDNKMYIRWTKQCICSKCEEKPIPIREIHTIFDGMSYDYYDACDNQENSSSSSKPSGSLSIHYATHKGKTVRLEVAAPTEESAGTPFKLKGPRGVESATWVVVRHTCGKPEGDSERYFTKKEIDAKNHVETLKKDLEVLRAQLDEATTTRSASDEMLRTLREKIQQAEQTLANAHANAVLAVDGTMACGCTISQKGSFKLQTYWGGQTTRIVNEYILPNSELLPGICNAPNSKVLSGMYEMELPKATCASVATKDNFCPEGQTLDNNKSKAECKEPVCQPEDDAETCCKK